MASSVRLDDVRGKLRFVKIGKGLNLKYFPDFLILGPQRTGTTWLSSNLRLHPQVFCSDPKEIYFFNLLTSPGHRHYTSSELAWYLRFFRDTPLSYALKSFLALRRFGERYRPLVRGEATASYAAMSPELVEEVVTLNPEIKAILMIRDPIARAWSHAKKDLAKQHKRRSSDVSDEEFRAFFADPYQLRCGAYTEMIQTWSSRLRPGNLFLGRFDDISARPVDFLTSVYGFLGVASDAKYVTGMARFRINTTAGDGLPPQHRAQLQALFADELGRLERSYGLVWH